MRKLWIALLAAAMAAGTAHTAGGQNAPPVAPSPAAANPPQPQPPAGGLRELTPERVQSQLKMVTQAIGNWEDALGKARSDETRKILTDAIAKGKDFQVALQATSDALLAGVEKDIREAAARMRDMQQASQKYFALVGTAVEIDRFKAIQEEGGKDNPDLSARCQQIIDLLTKKLELQKQMSDVEEELVKARQAMRQSVRGAGPANAPGSGPAPSK